MREDFRERRGMRRRRGVVMARALWRVVWRRVRDGRSQAGWGVVDVGIRRGESGDMDSVGEGERDVSSRVGEGGDSGGMLAVEFEV